MRIGIDLGRMTFRSHQLEAVEATLVLTDSVLRVDDTSFGAWGGDVSGSVAIGIGEGPDQPFALSLDAEGVDALSFLSAMTPAGESVSGTLSLTLEASGSTEPHLLPIWIGVLLLLRSAGRQNGRSANDSQRAQGVDEPVGG